MMPSKSNKVSTGAEENDWMAEDDLRTLIAAEKIKQDKSRLAAAMKKKREMAKALANIGGDK